MKEGISFVTYNALLKTVHNTNTYESRHQTCFKGDPFPQKKNYKNCNYTQSIKSCH